MHMSTPRRWRSATTALLATTGLLAAALLAAAPAPAADVYYEWESEKSALNLVMAAKDTKPGSKVGLATDNNS